MITTSFWQEMGERQARWEVTGHPFLCRWADGTLRRVELADYACQNDHLVVATAAIWRRLAASDARFAGRAAEAEEEVRLWRELARQVGLGGGRGWAAVEDPLPATVGCVREWTGDRDRGLPESLAALCAIESLTAATSRLQLDALLEHYGFDDGPATEYLWRRATAGGEQRLLTSGWLAESLTDGDPGEMLEQIEAVHRAAWLLLEELEAAGVTA